MNPVPAVITLIVVGVLLWLVNKIPMHSTLKANINLVVTLEVFLWLLQALGFMDYLTNGRVIAR